MASLAKELAKGVLSGVAGYLFDEYGKALLGNKPYDIQAGVC